MSTEPITHLEQVVAGTTTPVTHLEQVVAGTTTPVTHLEHVISENIGGGSATLIEKTVTQNGVYNAADDSADGYSKVTANVPNSYAAGDEGKVVSGGALVAQSSSTMRENGTVDTTLINSLTVNVGGYELLASGSYTRPDNVGSPLQIPVSYTGTPKLYGVIVDEALADTGQMMCAYVLIDEDVFPDEFVAPDGLYKRMAGAWGFRADGSIMHGELSTDGSASSLSSSMMLFVRISSTYPWRPNTYTWYIWGVPA